MQLRSARTVLRRVLPSAVSALPALSVVAALACGSGTSAGVPSSEPDAGTTAAAVTFYRDVKPILDAKCTQCHAPGGIAPFTLTSAEDAVAHRSSMASATQAKTMPPWPPSNACNTYIGDRSLTDVQIAMIKAWADGGGALGDPSDYVQATSKAVTLSRVDRKLTLRQAYAPKQRPDDYRCFVLDWPDTTTKFLTGFGALPEQGAIVHHMLAYIAGPGQVAEIQKLDVADPDVGYACFGGPGADDPGIRLAGGWAPGALGMDFPANTGVRIEPGSKIVLQIHYNTSAAATDVTDQSSIAFKVDDAVAKEAVVTPFANPQWLGGGAMKIPAGAADATHSFQYDLVQALAYTGSAKADAPITVYGAALHMHLHGTRAKMSITRAKGAGEACLLDIPHWNFHWQGSYGLATPMTVDPGDVLSLECHWDNSAGNQSTVNGVSMPPHDLDWGEGTGDEMCLGYLYVTQ